MTAAPSLLGAFIGLVAVQGFVAPLNSLLGESLTYTHGTTYLARPVMMAERTPLIAGNWKMNPTSLDAAVKLACEIKAAAQGKDDVEVAVFPPHPFLVPVVEQLAGSKVKTGAQNVYVEDSGAFTGAVSTSMIQTAGCYYVLLGHSERRTLFREDDALINKKVRKALGSGLKPILCIGESKEEYESGLVKEVCAVQLGKNLAGVTAEHMADMVIAYEPVWAIGTGLSATPEIAQSVHAYIRSWIAEKYGQPIADQVRLQYGGSVTPDTVDELMACPDIDGALVGGASLVGDKFARIIGFKTQVAA